MILRLLIATLLLLAISGCIAKEELKEGQENIEVLSKDLKGLYTNHKESLEKMSEDGYDTTEAEAELKKLETLINNNQLEEAAESLERVITKSQGLEFKTCAERKGYICRPNGQESCEGKNLDAKDSDYCCNEPCTSACDMAKCPGDHKCVNGKCILKTCEEAQGYICKKSETQCTDTYFTDLGGNLCCYKPCKSACETNPCPENHKCVNGECIRKTCSEAKGYICNTGEQITTEEAAEAICEGKSFTDSEGKMCCDKSCNSFCGSGSCGPYDKCVNDKCQLKTCGEYGGNVCGNDSHCLGMNFIDAEGKNCCTEACQSAACEQNPCSKNSKCVNGQCINKTCSEANGYICNSPEFICGGENFLDLEGKECCKEQCKPQCDFCGESGKCVNGICQLKTCAEQEGYLCNSPITQCYASPLTAADGSCCSEPCKSQCEANPCASHKKCVNGVCVAKTCAEQNGYVCNPPSTQCYANTLGAADVADGLCCPEQCKIPCDIRPCNLNETCVEGQCV